MDCPIVAEHYLCGDDSVEFTVFENVASLSGESYTIKDPEGNVVFKMDGHALSIRDRCTLLDADGCPILTARKKFVSMHERWEVYRGDSTDDDDVIFTVKKSWVLELITHLKVYLTSNDEEDFPDFEVKGNFFERDAQIFHKDQLIAEVKRKFDIDNVLLSQHTFNVLVYPNVDQAFIATLVIIMDRIHED